MIEAKNIKSNNMLDVDSNLNVIYCELDKIKQQQNTIITGVFATNQYSGYNSEYVEPNFTDMSSSFNSNDLYWDADLGRFVVNNSSVTRVIVEANFTISAANASDKLLYARINQYYGEAGPYQNAQAGLRVYPFYVNAGDGRMGVTAKFIFDILDGVDSFTLAITSSLSAQPTIQVGSIMVTGINRSTQ